MAPNEPRINETSLFLLERVRQGDELAAEAIFTRYFARLTLLTRRLLSARLLRRVEPEDVVLSAYRSFFIAARDGRFVLERGGDLWRLLASITRHKALRQARRQTAARRTVDRERALEPASEAELPNHGNEPRPEEAVALAEELEWIFAQLSPGGRTVLELRLQGAELSAIAAATERSERTVRRTLAEIRQLMATRFHDD